MIDTRIYTFLELCKQMNYRKTAEILNMTQPAVTQHIKYLENLYNCSLFNYSNKKLTKTEKCKELEHYAKSIISLNLTTIEKLSKNEKMHIKIGATKTIGEYTIDEYAINLISDKNIEFTLIIDNTERLLEQLDRFELDFLMLEGYIDKKQYGYKIISTEEIVGICSTTHKFANQEITLNDIFKENIILREKGSGTRAVFEHFLQEQNFTIDSFFNKSVTNSYKLIEKSVELGFAISFVYDVIPKQNKNLATFKIKNSKISHEFNYVFLKNSYVEEKISLLLK